MLEIAILIVVLIILIWLMRDSSNNPITAPDTDGYGVPYVKPPPAPLGIGGSCMKGSNGTSWVINPAECKEFANADGTCGIPVCSNGGNSQLVFTNVPLGADATVKLPKADQAGCSAIGGNFVNGSCQTYMIKKSSLNSKTKYFGPLAPTAENADNLKNKVSSGLGTFYSTTADGCAGGKYDPTTKVCSFNWYAFTA